MDFNPGSTKEKVFSEAERFLNNKGLAIVAHDISRPWGGFFVIDEKMADKFISLFFPGFTFSEMMISGKLSPKILIVAPHTRLSWQYHHRRAELWTLIAGDASVVTGDTDAENETKELQAGAFTELKQGERHRLIGLQNWGVVAEIWRHTDPLHPSDEDDIVRVQDDFGRGK